MKRLLTILMLFCSAISFAQPASEWPSPEVEQMYQQARQQMMQGHLQQAIVTYQQAITLAPDKMVLYRDLAQTYYLAGAYDDALKVLEPVMKNNDGDELAYQVKAACLIANKETKKAKSTLQEALKRYPKSGILYHELGRMYENDESLTYALESWLDGIQADPAYYLNYYEAARMYMGTTKPVWAVIYAEMYLNMEQHGARADETRDMLLGAYMRLFKSLGTGGIPKYKERAKLSSAKPLSFEDAVNRTYLQLSPIISDGINTENLIMLRTRFLMEWSRSYAVQFPFSMFHRWDNITRSGYFDAYNQWIFGKIDNPREFEAWTKFHADALPEFEKWLAMHTYRPVSTDFYNAKVVDDIFVKEKKQ